jgi:hypothetical protein
MNRLLIPAVIVLTLLTIALVITVLFLAMAHRDMRRDAQHADEEILRLKRDLRDLTFENLTLKGHARDHGSPLEHLRRLVDEAREGTATPIPAPCVCGGTCRYRTDSHQDCPPACQFCASLSADADDLREGKDQS